PGVSAAAWGWRVGGLSCLLENSSGQLCRASTGTGQRFGRRGDQSRTGCGNAAGRIADGPFRLARLFPGDWVLESVVASALVDVGTTHLLLDNLCARTWNAPDSWTPRGVGDV